MYTLLPIGIGTGLIEAQQRVLVRGLGEPSLVLKLLAGGEKVGQAAGLALVGIGDVARYGALLYFERADTSLHDSYGREVGQSASGLISQALELGCRIIASRTHTFLGFGEYHPNAIEFFDIGNYLELAERLREPRQFPGRPGLPEYNVETNKAVYLLANSALAQRRPAVRSFRNRVGALSR